MDNQREVFISKYMSYILRHHPEDIQLTLDAQGWADVDILLENSAKFDNKNLTKEELFFVVANNGKKRFDLSEDKQQIRANQGHSVEIHLDLPSVEPPEFLYHGTAVQFVDAIKKEGIKQMRRHDVHLSFDEKTARTVGERHGKPIILKVYAKRMYENGSEFKCTKNNVWLTKHVAPEFFEVI